MILHIATMAQQLLNSAPEHKVAGSMPNAAATFQQRQNAKTLSTMLFVHIN